MKKIVFFILFIFLWVPIESMLNKRPCCFTLRTYHTGKSYTNDSNPHLLKIRDDYYLNTHPAIKKRLSLYLNRRDNAKSVDFLNDRKVTFYKETNRKIHALAFANKSFELIDCMLNLSPLTKALILDQADSDGRTLLHKALALPHTPSASIFIHLLAYVGAIDNARNSIIMSNIWKLEPRILHLCLARGTNPFQKNLHGQTALHLLSQKSSSIDFDFYEKRHPEIAQILLDKGVSFCEPDRENLSAIEWAALTVHTKLYRLYLRKLGASRASASEHVRKKIALRIKCGDEFQGMA